MKRSLLILLLFTSLLSCNIFSGRNISNDWKWKSKTFKNTVKVKLNFNPQILKSGLSSPVFYAQGADSINFTEHYNIVGTLKRKLYKRNILTSNDANTTLSIDELIFKEYYKDVSVSVSDDYDYEYSEEDYFEFIIVGYLEDNTGYSEKITAKIKHNTSPRESYFLCGMVAKDGINAKASNMIENTLNEFSYYVYQAIKDKG